jgi:lactose/cellobiose-specific phosphotransferase system IIC component
MGDGVRLKFLDISENIGNRIFFLAIQRSLALALPLIMLGALVLMIRDFPLSHYQNWLSATLGSPGLALCDNLIAGSFGIASLAVLCAYAAVMAGLHNQRQGHKTVSPIMALVVVLSCYFVATGSNDVRLALDRGLFFSLCLAATATPLYLALAQNPRLRLPLGAVGNDYVIRDILTVMPAGMLTILTFALARMFITSYGFPDLQAWVPQAILAPFREDGLAMGLAYSGLSQLFWFFGAHGPNLLFSVEESILLPASAANVAAAALGDPAIHIFTKPFFDAFTRMGGSGSTLCLIIAILYRSQNSGDRRLCTFALLPALCNVNEPLLFGIPLVLNPIYLIPFLLAPILQTVSAYAATALDRSFFLNVR